MRLLHSRTLQLEEFVGNNIPPYAILSHTWEEEEVTFQDMHSGKSTSKKGYVKIMKCCERALQDGFEYVWVDTCCIDKTSSAELSESINSMFRWYKLAGICYAYLSDMPTYSTKREDVARFPKCRWFTRGWTLQELLAPREVLFFSQDWVEIGNRDKWANTIYLHQGIHVEALTGDVEKIRSFSVAQKFCWASRRNATREEDMAYALLGIFDVHMPLLYGEGRRSFFRLQEEIMKNSDDHSIFSWHSKEDNDFGLCGMLAPSPAYFAQCHRMVPYRNWGSSEPYELTNVGLRIKAGLFRDTIDDELYMVLQCYDVTMPERMFGIPLAQLYPNGDQFARKGLQFFMGASGCEYLPPRTIFIRNSIILPEAHSVQSTGKRISFQVISGSNIHVRDAWPFRQWSAGVVNPPNFLSNNDTGMPNPAHFNWSWHVALRINVRLGGPFANRLQNSEQVVVIGYNGRTDKCWCDISSNSGYNLSTIWHMITYSGSAEYRSRLYLKDHSEMPFLSISLIDPSGGIASSPITPDSSEGPVTIKAILRVNLPEYTDIQAKSERHNMGMTNQ